jgi:hypothetical protein
LNVVFHPKLPIEGVLQLQLLLGDVLNENGGHGYNVSPMHNPQVGISMHASGVVAFLYILKYFQSRMTSVH